MHIPRVNLEEKVEHRKHSQQVRYRNHRQENSRASLGKSEGTQKVEEESTLRKTQ